MPLEPVRLTYGLDPQLAQGVKKGWWAESPWAEGSFAFFILAQGYNAGTDYRIYRDKS